MEETHLWRRVLVARFGLGDGGWCMGKVRGSHGCGLWKGKLAVWETFIQHVGFPVGHGNRVRFWHDCWCGDRTFKEAYPALYDCASILEATIDSILIRQNGGADWNVSFVQNFNDWEMKDVASFPNLLSHIPVSSDSDGLCWRLKKDGVFDIRSFYTVLRGSLKRAFPWRSVWHSKAPPRVCFFIWCASWDKILTCDNLIRRGYSMPSWCCMCRSSGEPVFFFIVLWRERCGILFSILLIFNGSYQKGLWIFCVVGGILWVDIIQTYGT
jgi:hypothetical protein